MLGSMPLLLGYLGQVPARESYFEKNCESCHSEALRMTCKGCHAHGTHSSKLKNDLNLTATLNSKHFQPGSLIRVTVTGGYDPYGWNDQWVRVVLYDEKGAELARSTGPNGMGGGLPLASGIPIGSTCFECPIKLYTRAPAAVGTYTYSVSWYGNKYDKTGAFFGPKWKADPNNPNHGEEFVSFSFEVDAPSLNGASVKNVSTTLTDALASQKTTDNHKEH